MRLLVLSDLHGDLAAAEEALEAARPDALLCCGDWGDPGEIELPDLERLSRTVPIHTVFGNHDHLSALADWNNADGTPVLLRPGEIRRIGPLMVAGISGIWAKSHRQPYYVTDADVEAVVEQLARTGLPIDVLLSHEAPLGVADQTWQGRHAGKACFQRALRTLAPRVYLSGHLHRAQEYRTQAGQVIRNVGDSRRGDAVLLETEGTRLEVRAWSFRNRTLRPTPARPCD